jgi:hypothetical protein
MNWGGKLNNNDEFKKCFVVFLDVLGVRNSIYKQDRDLINKLIKVLKINSKFEPDIKNTSGGKLEIRSWYFSDSFVFLMKEEYGKDNLSQLFLIIRYLQDKFWESGFCLRGAITLDDMYYPKENENVLLGKGIIQAYKLESEIAIYPRIVVDEEVYNFIKSNKLRGYPFGKKGTKLTELIEIDKDGVYFLDLLDPKILRIEGEKIKEIKCKKLNSKNLRKKGEKIKCKKEEKYFSITWNSDKSKFKYIRDKVGEIVEGGLKNENIKIKQKYEWLKSYLNEIEYRCKHDN